MQSPGSVCSPTSALDRARRKFEIFRCKQSNEVSTKQRSLIFPVERHKQNWFQAPCTVASSVHIKRSVSSRSGLLVCTRIIQSSWHGRRGLRRRRPHQTSSQRRPPQRTSPHQLPTQTALRQNRKRRSQKMTQGQGANSAAVSGERFTKRRRGTKTPRSCTRPWSQQASR